MKTIKKTNTLEELSSLKEKFLHECNLQENKIKVANIIANIGNFIDAKRIFEAVTPSLLKKKQGKALINSYVSTIKENRSLKTLYALYEGLKDNKTTEDKKNYITEALVISEPLSSDEYISGMKNIVKNITESFKLLGDEFVLENIKEDKTSTMIGESLIYLLTTKRNIRNLNEHMMHVNNVSEVLCESTKGEINVDKTLEEIVTGLKENASIGKNIDSIFETDDKEQTFDETKKVCLEMISKQKSLSNDNEIITKLTEMENKLSVKAYNFESFTKDMIYMNDLKEVLK